MLISSTEENPNVCSDQKINTKTKKHTVCYIFYVPAKRDRPVIQFTRDVVAGK